MFNQVNIQFCYFENIDNEGKATGEKKLGYRIFDKYGQDYKEGFENINDLKEIVKKENLLEYIGENHEQFYDSVVENGVKVNGKLVTFDEFFEE